MVLFMSFNDYYKSFYDNNFCRDFRSLPNGSPSFINNDILANHNPKTNDNVLSFINKLRNKPYRLLGGECSYLENFNNYINCFGRNSKNNNVIYLRYYDRFFFDFDTENKMLHDLKKLIIEAFKNSKSMKEAYSKAYPLQKEYQRLLLFNNGSMLYPSFSECKKLHDYLISKDIVSYPVFSGSKGCHLYVFFPDRAFLQFDKISEYLYSYFKYILELNTMDEAVSKDATSRLSRVPYSIHGISGLYTVPFSFSSDGIIEDVNRVLHIAQHPQIPNSIPMNMIKEGNKCILDKLKVLDNQFQNKQYNKSMENIRQEKICNSYTKTYHRLTKRGGNTTNKSRYNDIDMRELVKCYLGDPEATYNKGYNSYICPFHNDTVPSAFVNSRRFVCSVASCEAYEPMNYYDFIKAIKGFTKKEEVLKELDNLNM